MNRDRDGSLGSESCKGGRAENELNVGAKSRGEWREELVLGVGGELDRVYASGCVVFRTVNVPKREYSGPEVLKSGSRSGTDASAEMVRLWTSPRLLRVADVTSLEDEPSACFFLRLDARRRAKGTIMRMRATMKTTPPMAATTIMTSLFLVGEWGVVVVAVRAPDVVGSLILALTQDNPRAQSLTVGRGTPYPRVKRSGWES
jgi:hypothetical protein